MKQLRFTLAERLTRLPGGEITEISLDEVSTIVPEVAQEELKCPQCQRDKGAMFWYQ
jgi:hypothetical protein